MPFWARPTWSNRRRACYGGATLGLFAAFLVFSASIAGEASATTISMVFPLEKRVPVLHDYLADRGDHLHQGTDLMAPKMTRAVACVSGTVTLRVGTYGGVPAYSLWLAGDDGHGYFYIHINNDTPGTDDGQGGLAYAFAPGLVSGAHVEQGQFIAYVGDSGNAEGTAPHLHFEIHETTSMSSPSLDPYDSLAGAPLAGGIPAAPAPVVTRYEQSSSRIAYLGKWTTFTTSGASGGSYKYADSPAMALIWFTGTRLDLIATTGVTQGKAQVTVDGRDAETVDLSSPTTLRKQTVWSTGTLPLATHKVVVSWTGRPGGSGGTRVNIDAVDVTGTAVPALLQTVEQEDARLSYRNSWTLSSTSMASGGSLRVVNRTGSSVTIKFTGYYLSWLAKKGPVCGLAKVTLDARTPVTVDLYRATNAYKQKVWSSGVLAYGPHTVLIEWTGKRNPAASGTSINIDALQLLETLD